VSQTLYRTDFNPTDATVMMRAGITSGKSDHATFYIRSGKWF
jgi:hypothetical protein